MVLCQRLATPDGIVISSVLGSVAAEGAEGTTGGEPSDDSSTVANRQGLQEGPVVIDTVRHCSSITVVQIGQNGEYLGTARLPAQTEGTCYRSPSPGKLPDREFDPACGGRRRSARPRFDHKLC
ncbi:hypothetical protein NQZ68_036299 [Dissostichus eleginoides]|nr:hypothetical protein NQZ68_036299 [Dissostichus eleginoides]